MGYGKGTTASFFCPSGPELKVISLPFLHLFRKANTFYDLPKTQTCSRVFLFDWKSLGLVDRLIHSKVYLL